MPNIPNPSAFHQWISLRTKAKAVPNKNTPGRNWAAEREALAAREEQLKQEESNVKVIA